MRNVVPFFLPKTLGFQLLNIYCHLETFYSNYFKENQNQAPGFISEELNTSEILDCQGRNSGIFLKNSILSLTGQLCGLVSVLDERVRINRSVRFFGWTVRVT